MFIGHFAPAFVAKAVSKDAPSLGTLFIAAQLVDWAFMLLFFAGLEKARIVPGITVMSALDLYHMPYTHSLLGTIAFAVVIVLIVAYFSRSLAAGVCVAGVVVSHWLLDLLVHRPDLTIAGGSTKFGLGLWNYPWIEMPLEMGLLIGAFIWYMHASTGPRSRSLILLAVMVLAQLFSWFGPQPTEYTPALPATALIAFGGLTALAYWSDRSRRFERRGLAMEAASR